MLDRANFPRWMVGAITARDAPAHMPAAFAVYRNTWLQGLVDALAGNYPTVAMLLGPELFEALAIHYARGHPATTPVLAKYGAEFPAFLGQHEVGQDIPYLRDVAALERLWTECFFAPDAAALMPGAYAMLSPAQLVRLRPNLHPAARLACFETPAVTIWRAHRAEGEFKEIEPEWRPERALIARRGISVTVTRIDDAAYRVLDHIQHGEAIGSAIACAAEQHPGSDLANALTTIIESGALTGASQS